MPVEELHPELSLELLNRPRERGLCDVRPFGPGGEAPRLGHGREVSQVPEFQVVPRYASAL